MSAEPRQPKSLGKVAKQGVLWSVLRESITELVLFPSSMILGRLLSPKEFGIAVAALFFTQLAQRLSEVGFNMAIVRAKVVTDAHLSSVFLVNIVLGIATFALLTGLAPFVSAFYHQPETGHILPIAAVAFLILPIGTVPAGVLTRNLQFKESAQIDWYQGLAFAVATVVLAWFGYSYMSMVYGRLIAVTVQTYFRLYYARWRPRMAFSAEALREVLSFGSGMYAKRLLDFTAGNIDNLLIGRFFGMVTLGLYDKAYSTMNRFLSRMNSSGPGVTFRIFSMIDEQPERFRRAYRKVLLTTTVVGYPVFAGLIVAAPQLMVVLFGHQWLSAAVPFQVLCVSAAMRLINSYASAATQAAGRIWSEVWRQALYAALIGITLMLLRGWGAVGAAGAVLFATGVMTVLMHVLLSKATGLSWSDIIEPQIPATLCAAAVVGAELLVRYAIVTGAPRPAPLLILACEAVAAAAVLIGFVLFGPSREVRAIVCEMTQDLAPAVVKRHRWVRSYLDAQTATQAAPATL